MMLEGVANFIPVGAYSIGPGVVMEGLESPASFYFVESATLWTSNE
jgi:hypothetical protein